MNYREIIVENCKKHSSVDWWPKFAYHFTDITNVVNILSCAKLYSRTIASELGLMTNDNASRQVIDVTQAEALASVRFYFRPLTPTQYHIEGFKHPDLRYDDDFEANIPLPIFLLFDLEKILTTKGVNFSEKPQSGHGNKKYNSADDFAKFQFDKIYSKGFSDNKDEIKKYRQAEIFFHNEFDIDNSLNFVLCRNNSERITLLNCLKEKNLKVYEKYKSFIKVYKENVFENNALFVDDCQYHSDLISIKFSEPYKKNRYTEFQKKKKGLTALRPLKGKLELTWHNSHSTLRQICIEAPIDYEKAETILFKNIPDQDGKYIKIKFYLEDKLMCFYEQSLKDIEML